MPNDNSNGTTSDRVAKDLPWVNQGGCMITDGDKVYSPDMVAIIKVQRKEVFPGLSNCPCADECGRLFRSAHRINWPVIGEHKAFCKLRSGSDTQCAQWAQMGDGVKLAQRSSAKQRKPWISLQQPGDCLVGAMSIANQSSQEGMIRHPIANTLNHVANCLCARRLHSGIGYVGPHRTS
jgi:hypothetical protein